ncbi:MAG: hypothetical protein IPL17_16650 [Anaerolineales bacterium]|nr:hypothetical protein [Anaerolineales bacterium]
MEEGGLVEKEIIEREERLDMKIYNITETGRGELHQWLCALCPNTTPASLPHSSLISAAHSATRRF